MLSMAGYVLSIIEEYLDIKSLNIYSWCRTQSMRAARFHFAVTAKYNTRFSSCNY